MNKPHTPTAVALLFGLGAAMATLPAHAQQQGDIVGGGEAGAIHPLDAHPARPDVVALCDRDGDGFVNVAEARVCYEQHYGYISGGMDHITFEEFARGLRRGEDAEALWAQIPREREEVMTRREWMAWRDQEFAAAAPEDPIGAEEVEPQPADVTPAERPPVPAAAGVYLSPSALAEVQRRLNAAGYAAGPVDGIWGPNTSGAVASFQRDEGLDATGTLTFETLHALGLSGLLTGEGMPEAMAGVRPPEEPAEAEPPAEDPQVQGELGHGW
jgi:hypothetical protein